ncbi:MAG: hypothetical protein HXY53_03225 [Nitrospirae bacterium]|nr:hypothetical protein [Nitrospirota bacterium]
MMIFRNISASKNSSGYKPELHNVLQQEIQDCWAFIPAREFGYKCKEIASYLQKDPSVITRYLKERKRFKADIKHALNMLNGKTICNKQV